MKLRAEVFDQVQRLFDLKGFNDHQLHALLRFDAGQGPDVAILEKAVIASIEAIPILGTRYVAGDRPHWVGLDSSEWARSFLVARTEAELESALIARSDEERGPQVRVSLLATEPTALAVTMNHMIGDGAGFKSYLYFLCALYSRLAADPGYKPQPLTGGRGIGRVLGRVSLGSKMRALFTQSGDLERSHDRPFPLGAGGPTRPFIATRKIDREQTAAFRDYGHARGATLNDLVLTAFYRCLFRRLGLGAGAALTVPAMVDMRRYLGAGEEFSALTNLSSMVATHLDYRPDENFAATLGRVKAAMDEKKSRDIGLNNFVTLGLVFRLAGDRWANRLLRVKLKFPLICMTNIGVLDDARLTFGDRTPNDAYLCGSIKYRPYFQVAMTSYRGELTLSINLDGTDSDRATADAVLGDIEAELAVATAVQHESSPARAQPS